MYFYSEDIRSGLNWKGFERFVARLILHLGWKEVSLIGAKGDQGGDVLATRKEKDGTVKSWVIQCKSVSGTNYVSTKAIEEAVHASGKYGAQVIVVATNGEFTQSAVARKNELIHHNFDVRLWNGAFLSGLLDRSPRFSLNRRTLRKYQDEIVKKVLDAYENGEKRAFYIVATGLGKTVIAASIAQSLWERGCRRILVLCHATDLALQLEQGFWPYIEKDIPTSVFLNGLPPKTSEGISFGLYQSLAGYLGGLNEEQFDAIIVDEAHHAMAHGFRLCIENFKPKFLVGMTATPWRGDNQSLTDIFGEPLQRVSLVDGMALGYLSQVDYRIFCDNVNWEEVPKLANSKVSIKDLNKRLFLPQRDEAVIGALKGIYKEFKRPRIAVFSPSLKHCEYFSQMLTANGIPCTSLSCDNKVERRERLLKFSTGEFTAVTAVDVMNEGIDIPDVNVLVFLRATHSRRIFIQQLGRGLRISDDKEKVIVLDFVSDIRRLADVVELNNEGKAKGEKDNIVFLKEGIVSFSNERTGKFIQEWLEDMANLGDEDDDSKLTFPEGF